MNLSRKVALVTGSCIRVGLGCPSLMIFTQCRLPTGIAMRPKVPKPSNSKDCSPLSIRDKNCMKTPLSFPHREGHPRVGLS